MKLLPSKEEIKKVLEKMAPCYVFQYVARNFQRYYYPDNDDIDISEAAELCLVDRYAEIKDYEEEDIPF